MKKLLSIILLLVFVIFKGHCQTPAVLDEKDGFKYLKFGTEKSEIRDLKFIGSQYGVEYYSLQPPSLDLYYVFDLHFYEIIVGFKSNKLMLVSLSKTGNYTRSGNREVLIEDLKYLYSEFSKVLGPDVFQHDKDDTAISHSWNGKKCSLKIVRDINRAYINDEGNPVMEMCCV